MTPLTNGPVDANAVETTVLKLWQEFLARYFDGNQHNVGATDNLPFPSCELHFQQSAVTQPLSSTASITMVWSDGDKRNWTAWENFTAPGGDTGPTRQEICYERVAWNFFVRASTSNAQANCKLAADRLFALLGNRGETHALGQKGVCRLKPSAPRVIMETEYSLRLVTCAGTLRYPILSQT